MVFNAIFNEEKVLGISSAFDQQQLSLSGKFFHGQSHNATHETVNNISHSTRL